MAEKHLSRGPKYAKQAEPGHLIDANWWFYEHPGGLHIIRSPAARFSDAIIPLAAIRAYLKRLDRK